MLRQFFSKSVENLKWVYNWVYFKNYVIKMSLNFTKYERNNLQKQVNIKIAKQAGVDKSKYLSNNNKYINFSSKKKALSSSI